MAYNLPKVDPFVVGVANEVGSKFGVKTIGGWRAGPPAKYGAYDHPLGLALDVMTNNLGAPARSNPTGQAIANYATANADRLGINFVIWNKQSWNRNTRKWKPYSGDSDHTDHVHLSFLNPGDRAKVGAGSGAVVDTGGGGILGGVGGDLKDAVGEAAGALRTMAGGVTAVGELARKLMWLALPSTQVRLVTGGLGVGFLIVGVWLLAREARNGR